MSLLVVVSLARDDAESASECPLVAHGDVRDGRGALLSGRAAAFGSVELVPELRVSPREGGVMLYELVECNFETLHALVERRRLLGDF